MPDAKMPDTDPVQLTADLIRCRSVTPEEGGALTLLADLLAGAGFECHRVDRGEVSNLFARWGKKGARTLGYNGHTDVVPTGDESSWTHPPFAAHRENGVLWGRGATDMKSGVAAFVAAAMDFVRDTPPDGAIILTITGDEEGLAEDGTVALLDWMDARGEAMDHCIVGEPTCIEDFGDMIKIGRRGSLTLRIAAKGVQGHSAYPHRARNPVHALITLLAELTANPLDAGTEHFEPSTLQVVSVDVGNPATNVIPESAHAVVNIRFNDAHDGAGLIRAITARADRIAGETGVALSIASRISGESFLTAPGAFTDTVRAAITEASGVEPVLSTSGGTSDARFIKNHCPVVEFGLVGRFMHQVDERVPEAEITALKAAYQKIMRSYFS